MQRKRKQIFRKDRQDFPNLHKLIRLAKEEVNYNELNVNEIKKKMITDEMNQINFYDIVIPKVPGLMDNFHSLHNSTDSNVFKGIKINSGVQYSGDQKKVRNELKKQPGGLMLLKEMYTLFLNLVIRHLRKILITLFKDLNHKEKFLMEIINQCHPFWNLMLMLFKI